MTPDRDRTLWMAVRMALLGLVDAIERAFDIAPRTSELRKQARH